MIDIKYFLINLDDNKDRLLSAQSQLEKSNISFERVSAYDGRLLNINDFPRYNPTKARSYMGRDLVGGEIGCFLSHIKCVELFLKSNAEFAVILEDDFKLNSDLQEITNEILLQISSGISWNLINIGNEKIKISSPIISINHPSIQTVLCMAFYFPMTTTGLIWNRKGAEAFLKETHEIFAPVDNFLRYWLTRNGLGLAFDNPLVKTICAETTIDVSDKIKRKNNNNKKLHRLIKHRRLMLEKSIAVTNLLKNFIQKNIFPK